MRIGVLADDLSGAMNIGVEFATAGYSTQVTYGTPPAAAEVWICNTETRNSDPATAHAQSKIAAQSLAAWGPDITVKKIDSLLRGAIGQEMDALLEVTGEARCLLIAAAPKLNRITVGGYCLIDGEPLDQARRRVDPSSQVKGVSVPAIIQAQSSRPVLHVSLETIRQGEAALKSAINSHTGILTADCTSQHDLNLVVTAGYAAGVRVFAGTYGLGEAITTLLPTSETAPVLVLLGSLSKATQVQAATLVRTIPVEQVEIIIDERFIISEPEAYAAPYIEQLKVAISSKHPVLVISRVRDVDALHQSAIRQGVTLMQMQQRVEHLLQAILRPVISEFAGFIASGGATANALYHLLDADRLELEPWEVLPGVPLARLRGGTHDAAPFIAKPGSQGADDALCHLLLAAKRAIVD